MNVGEIDGAARRCTFGVVHGERNTSGMGAIRSERRVELSALGAPPRRRAERACDYTVLTAAVAFLVWRMHPSLVLADTLPAGGDVSSHVWGPDFLARVLFPSVSGWSWDWFAGFPAYVFYPVLPAVWVDVLNLVLPYGIALKLAVVSGPVLVVVASWSFARLWRLPFPAVPLCAIAALVLTFDPSGAAGGTLRSSVVGEYGHTLALGLGVLALGLLAPAMGKERAVPAATCFAAAALAHPLGLIFLGVGVAAIMVTHIGPDWRVVAIRISSVVGVGTALAGVWWIPFVLRHQEMTSPDFPRHVVVGDLLPFGWAEPVLLALAATGVALGLRAGRRIVGALTIVALVFAVLYLLLPTGQLQHTRVLPFWSWARLTLAAIGLSELTPLVQVRLAGRPGSRWIGAAHGIPTGAMAVTLAAITIALQLPPVGSGGAYDRDLRLGLAGIQRNPQYPDYDALMTTMGELGRDRGCGRFMWSVDVTTTDFGTVANDIAPYWTKGCVASVSGLYYDSSATTPFISLTESLTGIAPLSFGPGLPYRSFDLQSGVRHMRYLGVRYYAARTEAVVSAAAADPRLEPVAVAGPWHVYELRDSAIVSPLTVEPLVFDIDEPWDQAWPIYTEQTANWDRRLLAREGPPAWQRLSSASLPPDRPLPLVQISQTDLREGGLSFEVDRVGVPVLVKASYYPTWKVRGAEGPFPVAGNMMVVVPTAGKVELNHGRGAPELLASMSAILGLVGLGFLGWSGLRNRRRNTNS